jgi:MoaA/NifB/PqqE/SkfB family radical SAM enzyme
MSLAQDLLKKIPQYTRNERHLRSVLQHGTPAKWANLANVEWERKRRKVKVSSYPYLMIIDACNYCNLRCPLCPTGLGDLGRQQSMLSLDHFKAYFDPLAPYLFEAYLHNWGESLINKQVFDMIAHAQASNVGTNLSSNLVITSSDDIDRLIDSGLEYLIVSLDGTDQESYGKYRVRGDFNRVIENMAELIRRRDARGKKTPIVEWQYIVMKQNEHQIQEAEKIAKKLNVDILRFIPVGMPYEFENRKETADKWFPLSFEGRSFSDHEEQQFGQAGKPGPCFYLYRSIVVNPDGGVSPCCVVYREESDFAKLGGERLIIDELWNNGHYQSARALFSTQNVPHTPTICDNCDIFTRHETKAHVQVVDVQSLKTWKDGTKR